MSLDQWTTLKTARLVKKVDFFYYAREGAGSVSFRMDTPDPQMPRPKLESLMDTFEKEATQAAGKVRARLGGKVKATQHPTVAAAHGRLSFLMNWYIDSMAKPLDAETQFRLEADAFRGWDTNFVGT